MTAPAATLGVHSEVGELRQVVVHRPGLELSRLTPSNVDDLLFDDIMWAERAREEHDAFVGQLTEGGVAVHYSRLEPDSGFARAVHAGAIADSAAIAAVGLVDLHVDASRSGAGARAAHLHAAWTGAFPLGANLSRVALHAASAAVRHVRLSVDALWRAAASFAAGSANACTGLANAATRTGHAACTTVCVAGRDVDACTGAAGLPYGAGRSASTL